MAIFRPFCAVRPSREKAAEVAALPYDVMSSKEARVICNDAPLSFLHVDKAEVDLPEGVDLYSDEVYRKAADNLKALIESGVLIRDNDRCFYLYQEIMDGRSQTGVVGCASVDDYRNGVIKKHELTVQEKEEDRVRHVDACNANTGLIFLAFLSVVVAAFVIRSLLRHQARIVHFNDINSFYPTLLCLLVSSSAVLYSTIQLLAPESWRHYYYHPTLNPFELPFHLGLFVLSVWVMLLVAMAAFDDVRRQLSASDALFYYLGLAGVCAVCYVVFSVTTLYYLGYPLLIGYVAFALHRYFRRSRTRYLCGRCGHPLQQKGRCPHCGAVND